MPISREHATRIFLPTLQEALNRMREEPLRLAYYTRFETALQIIEGKAIWMRNAGLMNDVYDVQHGIQAVSSFLADVPARRRLYEVLGTYHAGRVDATWLNYRHRLLGEVYITCFTEHPSGEDDYGRLSMWRAYCAQPDGVALVLNTAPFHLTTNEFNAYSSPVYYGHSSDFHQRALEVLDNIERERRPEWSQQEIADHFFMALLFGAVCLKHPGFSEEREWRVVHMPVAIPRPSRLNRRDGMLDPPQTIFEIPLRNDPAAGLVGLDPIELIERIIIGPSNRGAKIATDLAAALVSQGLLDAPARIVSSGIPLRPNSP